MLNIFGIYFFTSDVHPSLFTMISSFTEFLLFLIMIIVNLGFKSLVMSLLANNLNLENKLKK